MTCFQQLGVSATMKEINEEGSSIQGDSQQSKDEYVRCETLSPQILEADIMQGSANRRDLPSSGCAGLVLQNFIKLGLQARSLD